MTAEPYPQPLLLGPVPLKDELIEKTQDANPEIHRVLVAQCTALVRAVACADEIVAIGYGFPAEDPHGRFLLREGALRRGNRSPPEVRYYARCCDLDRVAGVLAEVFPGAWCKYEGECTRAGVMPMGST